MGKSKEWIGGERVRVAGTIAFPDDGGRAVHVKGETGEVIGASAAYRGEDGEKRVAVQLDADGSIVSIPEGALHNESKFSRAIAAFRSARELYRSQGEGEGE